MVSSSSTKRAARLAQKGKGKRVRFQGGTLFPMVVLLILVIGIGTIVYARASVPAADASPPTIEDHWHMAYGFSLCDQPEMVKLQGNLEDPNGEHYNDYVRTYVHSHDDGVIHWHPFSGVAVGKNAKLGVFLDNYGIELDRHDAEVPGGPERRQDLQRGRDEVPGRQGRRAVRHRVAEPGGHVERDALRHRLRRHPDEQEQPGDHDRLPAQGHRRSPSRRGPRTSPQLGAVDTGQAPVGASTTTVAGATTPPASGATTTTAPGAVGEPSATTAAGATTTTSATTTTAG